MDRTNNGEFDWSVCVERAAKRIGEFAEWRGLLDCEWLADRRLIGITDGLWSFPVHDPQGHVIAAHVRKNVGGWFYKPATSPQLFTIGDLSRAAVVHLFESQFDMIATATVLEFYLKNDVALAATRGAANAKLIKGRIPQGCVIYAYPQNDAAGEKWLNDICAYAGREVNAVWTPDPAKDVNDWIKSGAGKSDLEKEISRATVTYEDSITEEPKPLRPMFSWIHYGTSQIDRTKYHVGEGFLEIGGFVMLIGTGYVGKSTLVTQLSIYLAIGQSWLFFAVNRPLRIMVVQAEDPGNKLVKMGQMFKRMGLTDEQIQLADRNTAVLTIRDMQDASATREIERHALVFQPDIVIINPMTSYLSGSVYKDEVINKFLRVELTPMLDRLQMSAIVVHHPPKPVLNSKEPKDLTAFELQYGGAGMAALTNAPRGNMFLVHVDGDVFKLTVGKGFEDLGTKETTVYLRRSRDSAGIMLWEPCDQTQAEEATEKLDQRKAKQQNIKFVPYDRLLKLLKPTRKYRPTEIIQLVKKDLTRGKDWAKDAMSQLITEKKLAKSKLH